ncbi:VCBS domain-containing protein [Nodosilinea sp. PGN35]|uniref:VCBS domain-containing protein n=1 Tax=Nodosilinea sp. PGN35 TaxID=3020489 RepID=UPI00398B7683
MTPPLPAKQLFDLANISPVYASLLSPIAALLRDRLTDWFQQENFLSQAAIPFGATIESSSWTANALDLRQRVLDGNYSTRLETRSAAELKGALGAYSATGTTGQPTVYLNGDWLSTASAAQIQSVLLEELGHSFDDQINGGVDSAGDEGAIFAALVQGTVLNANQLAFLRAEDDTNVISLDGQELVVEQAIAFDPASSLWQNLARTGDPNKALSDGSWTANASDLVGNDATPYLQIQADGTSIAFKVLAEPQSGNFKALMGIFVDVDGDGSPDFTIQVNVGNVTGSYSVLEYDFIPIVRGIAADANTRPNNTVIPAANTGTYYNLKTGSSTNPSNFKVYGPAVRVGSDGVVDLDVDGDSVKENYYVFSFTLAQLSAFRSLVANTYNGGNPSSVYKEIPQWPSNQTKVYAAGLTASNSLNAVNGDIGGGPYSTSSSWKDIFGYQPPLPPIAANDIATVLEDGTLPVTGNLLANDTDPNNDPLQVTQFVVSGTTYTLDAGTPSRTLNLASGTLIVNRDGAYSFQPAANYAGPVPIVTYTVSDGALTTTATLAISITPVNDAPAGADKTVTINEDNAYTFSASDFGFTDSNDSPPHSLQGVVITTLPTTGSLTLNGAPLVAGAEITAAQIPLLVYTPVVNGSGANYANFTFQVRDSGGTANGGVNLDPTPNIITFNVTPVNDAPVAVADTATAVEAGGINNGTAGTNPTGNVLTNDTDVDAGDTKTVTSVGNAAANSTGIPAAGSTSGSSPATVTGLYGSLAIGADGSYTYTVNNSSAAVQALRLSSNTLTETFTYTIRDAVGATSTSTLAVTIQGANDSPIANDDFNSVSGTAAALPTTPITGNVLNNDTDVDAGDSKSIGATTSTATGSTTGTTSGVTVGTVSPTGILSVTIGAASPSTTAISSIVLGTINGGNNGVQPGDSVYLTNTTTPLLNGATPITVATISGSTITLSAQPTNVTLANGNSLIFTQNSNGTGNVNDALINTINTTTTVGNGGINPGEFVFRDADGSPLLDANGAQITVSTYNSATGAITFSAPTVTSLSGNPTLRFTTNSAGTTAANTAPLNSTGTPTTLNGGINIGDYVFINGGGALLDAFGNPVTVASYNSATGSITFNTPTVTALSGNPTLRFTTDLAGTASVNTAATTATNSSSSSNTVGVSGVNGSISVGMTVTGALEGGGTFTRTVTAYDPVAQKITVDGAALQVSTSSPNLTFTQALTGTVTLTGQYGTLQLNTGTGAYTYTAYSNLTSGNKVDTFNYTMNDGLNATSTATLTINVSVQTNPPNAIADAVTVTEGSDIAPGGNNAITGAGTGNNADTSAGGTLTVTGISFNGTAGTVGAALAGAYGSLTINSDGSYSYDLDDANATVDALNAGQSLTDTFIYTIRDGSNSQTDVASITITIQGANDNPVAVADAATATEAGGTGNDIPGFNPTGNVLLNDTDNDAGDTKTVARVIAGTGAPTTAVAANTNVVGTYGTLVINPDGSYSYTVNNGNSAVNALAVGQSVIDTFTYEVRDTAGGTHTTSLTITVNGANDAPINTVPALLTAAENTGLAIASISISDPENAVGQIIASELASVQLTVNNGQLSIGNLNGATISSGSNNSATLTLSGSQEQINLALATLSYQGNPSFNGADALTVTATDGLGLQAINTIPITVTPDNRALTVTSPTVNEGSPYAVFTVDGAPDQLVSLALAAGTATQGSDFSPNLEYWNGSAWVEYAGTPAAIPNTIPGGAANPDGLLFVRAVILDDAVFEGPETFTLTATNRAGTAAVGTAAIADNGTGLTFNTNGVSDGTTDGAVTKDDDRPLTVSSPTVNEASPYAIFSVGGVANQWVKLGLTDGTATGAGTDYGPGLEYWNGTTWATYTANTFIQIPAAGTLLVRTGILQDGVYEGSENFALTATNTGGTSTQGLGTIVDDGTGVKYPGTVTGGTPDIDTTGLDSDLSVAVVAATPVNEASPYALFTVTATAGQNLFLTLGNTASPADQDATITGFTLEYSYDGTTWFAYSTGDDDYSVPVVPGTGGSGIVYVRANIGSEADTLYEGPETFTLKADIIAGTTVTSTATATIVDDGTGTKFPGTVTGGVPDAVTTALDDDRLLTVTSPTVTEGTDPYAIFTVAGVAGQTVSLAIAGSGANPATAETDGVLNNGEDFGNGGLEYSLDGGTTWLPYAGGNVTIPAGGNFQIRTSITADSLVEVAETFSLTATYTSGGTKSAVGVGTIQDGNLPVTVSSPTVNEASPYAIFEVGGAANQQVTLSLADGTATGADYGPGLQYWDGTDWVNYTANALVSIPAGGTLLVRTTITNDGVYEGAETFTLTATNTGGTGTTGTGTIVDDGTGVKYPGNVTGGVPDTTTTNLDDDRLLTVTSPTVNEASPYAVFSVGGAANQQVTLSLADGTAIGADYGPAIQYWDGTDWVNYTANALVSIPAGGTLLVRTTITNDGVYEGAETFSLTATNTGGTGTTGTGTIVDDGTGVKYPGTVTGGVPDTTTTNLDDDRLLTVTSPTVNEASPYAVFSVGGAANQQVTLSLADGTAIGADYGPALQYWDGTDWVNYTANALVSIPAGGTLLVRTTITNDGVYEGAETFTLTATNTGGTGTTGTGTIVDDGTGVKFPGTVTGGVPDTATTNLDDDRPLTVSSPTVNEASPYAIFSVGGAANQQITLSLADGTAIGADYGPALQYWDGTTWVNYTANALVSIPAGGTLLVRTTIVNDGVYEGAETFTLTATNTGGTGGTGTGTIVDDGTGVKYTGVVTGGVPDTVTTNLDDDRPLTVSSPTVNEASPYVVFTVGGAANQQITLSLADGTATGADYGPGLQYWDGTDWVNYTANALVSIPAGGMLLVRTTIVNDGVFEGSETFTLTATNTGGTGTTGTGTIVDDGTGLKFPGTVTGGIPDTASTNLDDDRLLAVSSPTVNEASPYAVFTVGGAANQQITLSLADGTATGADYGPALQYWDGTDWVNYTANALVALSAGGSLLVRTTIVNDGVYEGAETFTLTATNTGGTGTNGTGTIVDDGTGVKYPGTVTGGTPDTATTNLDDDRPLTVTSPTVNEASPYAVFTVGGAANQQITLSLADGTATGADYGPALQYWDGTNWVNYTTNALVGIPAGGTLLVRTTIVNDGMYEGAETFTLTATNTGGTGTTGTGTVVDDGTGTKFPGTVTGSIPDTITTNLDDDRPLTVSSPMVNEASPYAVFTVGGAANQQVTLSLADGTATGADYGPGLQYWDGTDWVNYTANALVSIPAGGTLLVRTSIVNDGVYEGAETFTLTATNTGGTGTTGTGTIVDDGTGVKFPGTVSGGIPDTVATNLDDDRPLTVTSPTVNEASPYAVFTVGGAASQQVTLSLADGTATGADYGPGLQYWDGTDWVNYTANALVSIPAGGTLLVRTTITNDGVYEGAETFSLTATNTGGTGTTGTGTIVDDGTGVKFPGTVIGGIPDTATTNLDDDRSLTVTSPTVTEGVDSFALFTVAGVAGQTIALDTAGSGVNPATKETNAVLNDGEDFGNGGLEYSLDGGATWLLYAGGNVTIPAGGIVQVRTGITADTLAETAETFALTATYTSGGTKNAVGVGTIQDGSGTTVATDDTNAISEDAIAPVAGNLLLNDTDTNSASLSVVAVQRGGTTATDPTQPLVGSYGSLTWASDGTYSYSLDNTNPAVQAITVNQSLSEVFTYTVSNGTGGSDIATLTITINGTNDAPVLDLDSTQPGTGYGAVYDPAAGAKAIAPATLTILDIDDSTLASVTFTLFNRLNGSDERLVVGALPGGITASAYDPTTGSLTLTGLASLSDYQTAIAAVAYENTALFPNRQHRTVDITLSDGKDSSNTATTLVQWAGDGVNGTNGNDIIYGVNPDGSISGLSNPDIFYGYGGDDIITGGSDTDVIYGGDGNDMISAGGGNDSIYGEAGSDVINGGSGNDYLDGGDGDDIISGGSGNDWLLGGAGDDVLSGGSGNDVLIGGPGNDLLIGGIGNDTFKYQALTDGFDTIRDFEIVGDRIDLSAMGGLGWSNVQLQQSGLNTLLSVNVGGQTHALATLLDVNAHTITRQHFVFTA